MSLVARILVLALWAIFAPAAFAQGQPTAFTKADQFSPAFALSSSGVDIKAGTEIAWGTVSCTISTDTAVTLPTLVAGTDYEIRVKDDCSVYARSYSDTIVAGSKTLGGFHYLPGAPATDHDTGGTSTPAILKYSLWDIAYRPNCPVPRGMTKAGNAPFWVDIYFLGNSSNADGISRNNDTILTGSNPPVRALDFGGNGTSKYGNLNWWTANEFVAQWGKRLPTYGEMTLAAFGAQEGKGRGNHPVTTGLNTTNASIMWQDRRFTSKFGLIQAVASIWVWTSDHSDWEGTPATGPYGWDAYAVTEGRGELILQNSDDLTALLFGGKWNYEEINGTRASETIEKLWDNSPNIGVRGACDHYTRF